MDSLFPMTPPQSWAFLILLLGSIALAVWAVDEHVRRRAAEDELAEQRAEVGQLADRIEHIAEVVPLRADGPIEPVRQTAAPRDRIYDWAAESTL